ncbi:type VI secretion protein IcmF/TssM N-terminal domain-containing protein [Buttiauxella gaviniae]|uniref:type VI secretion protein IcmF/TssM N-terminal domain-containing protein n=1 Tax=Buttiauxella gaviniae TaxID=82990 RepID=UPI00397610A7
MLKRLLFFTGWALLLCLVFCLAVTITLWLDESLYMAVILWLSLLVAILVFRAAWIGMATLWQKRKLSRFYAPLQYSRLEQVLFEHWRTGATIIKRISRRHGGVPWFLLMGERCGKTSLLATAKLPIMSHQPENETVVPTRTLRWWFFKTAGFLDTSSFFLQGKPAAQSAWKKLAIWCGHLTAPAGVVVCVSCHDLQTKSMLELHQQARKIRTQLEPIMKSVRRKLPVHVVITACDQLDGFTLWAGKLSTKQRQQALGYGWQQSPVADRQDLSLLDPLFASLKQGIDLSRVSMLNGRMPEGETAALLDFSNNIAQLQNALHHYIAALCEPDAYFSSGSLAGVWLTASIELYPQQTRDALFVPNLISQVLPEYSQSRVPQAFAPHQQWLKKWGIFAATTVLSCALTISAWQTSKLLVSTQGDDPSSLTVRLQHHERWMENPWRYMPFLWLLRQRHQALEEALVQANRSAVKDIHLQLKTYRQKFYRVKPAQQREMILQLAQSILTRQAMLKGEALNALANLPKTTDALTLVAETPDLSERVKLAIERAQLRSSGQSSGILAMQQLLREMINSDAQWRWLIADDQQQEGLRITHFLSSSAHDSSLSGIWQDEGKRRVSRHIEQIQRASGESSLLPVFDSFWQQWPRLKQDAWLVFLLQMAQQEPLAAGQRASTAQLMAIAKGQDPISVFMHHTQQALAEISEYDAQPWLTELRRINALQHLPDAFSLLQFIDNREKRLRMTLRQWMSKDTGPLVISSGEVANWQQWREALHLAVNQAVTAGGQTLMLTEGLFSAGTAGQINPLTSAYLAWNHLHTPQAMTENDAGRSAVHALLKHQLTTLTANAMATSACWIEQNWHSKVLQPLGDRADQRSPAQQQEKAWRYLADFIKGPAISLMQPAAVGLQAGEFQGQSVPFTADFLQVVNHVLEPDDILLMPEREQTRSHDEISRLEQKIAQVEAQRAVLEKQSLKVNVASQPATIPGGARLMPIGTRLELHCANHSSLLESGSLLEEASFSWQPNQCSAITLTVKFPGTEIKHRYIGDSAWSDFLADFEQGERSFTLDEFSVEGIQPLTDLAIEQVLVRFTLSGHRAVRERWQQWKALNDEIIQLEDMREQQQVFQRSRQQPGYFQGKLATLPTSVAICAN